jgi:histidinol phosphatase-like PHP family hydrolase
MMLLQKVPQDLHIHTTFSETDSQIVPEQTIEMVAFAQHAEIVGISDHFEHFVPHRYKEYYEKVKSFGFWVGTEVNGHKSVPLAAEYNFDYYIYHCWGNTDADYVALKDLITTGKPVIIAHPYATQTDLKRVPQDCFIEINNRYIWRYDWEKLIPPFKNKFRWVIGSDAHQPNWLNQNIARQVAEDMGIMETILFKKKEVELIIGN